MKIYNVVGFHIGCTGHDPKHKTALAQRCGSGFIYDREFLKKGVLRRM
jgi:hypothetical protein